MDQIEVVNRDVNRDEKEQKPPTDENMPKPLSFDKYEPDYHKTYWEAVDSFKLDLLLENKNKIDKDVIASLNKMKKWTYNKSSGCRKKTVTYNQKYGGRLYPDGTSLVYLPSNYRNFLCGDFYDDVDIVNSMPSILVNLCKKLELKDYKTLECYVNNREDFLKEIARELNTTREIAKELILKANFGAGEDALEADLENDVPEKVLSIIKEVASIRKELIKHYKKLIEQIKKEAPKKKLKQYWEGSYLSFILAREEWKIIRCMSKFFEREGYKIGFLEFDGMKIKRNKKGVQEIHQKHIWECEEHIKKELGMDIKIKVKPMETNIILTDEDNEFNDPLYKKMKEQFEKTNFKVTHNPTCYVTEMKNSLGQHILVKKAKQLYSVANEEFRLNNNPFTDTWFDDPNKRVYHSIDFLPGEDVSDEIYNTFRGYHATLITDFKDVIEKERKAKKEPDWDENDILHKWFDQSCHNSKLDLIYQHIRYLCEDNSNVFMKFLDMIAYKLQHPLVLIPILWVFYGEKGCGKNIMIDWIGQFIFGADYYTSDTLTNIMDKYGNLRENKILINVDELSMSESRKFEEQLKRLITQQSLLIEEKYIPKQSVRNIALHIGTTNNENCLTLRAGDRRPKVYQCSNEPKGNFQYFKRLKEAMDDEEVQNLFFTAMMRREVTDDVLDETTYPESNIQTEMKQRNLPKIYNFINDTYIENYNKKFWKRATLLHDDYKDYIQKRYPRNDPISMTSFGISMKKIFEKKRKPNGVGYIIDKQKWDDHIIQKGIVFDNIELDVESDVEELEEDKF